VVESTLEQTSGAGITKLQSNLSYVKLFKPWNWIIGTGADIDYIEEDVQRRIALLIADLNQTIFRQMVGESGYFFIFNEENYALVHPSMAGKDVSLLKNPATGRSLTADLKTAALTPRQSLKYLWDKPGAEGEFVFLKKAFISYYEPLGWYICASIYRDDLEQKLSYITGMTIIFTSFILVVAFILSFYVSRSITLPLKKLVESIGRKDESGIPYAIEPSTGITEIKLLCSTMNNMLESISRSRKELKEERDFSTELINATPNIICRIDAEGITSFINPAGETTTGYSKEEIMGKSWWDIFYPDREFAQVEQLFAKFCDGEIFNHEIVLTCKDGEKKNIVWNSLTKRDDENNIMEIIGFGNDVTARKRAEEALRQSENELRTIFDNSVETIYNLNLLTGTYDYLSPSSKDTFGYTAAEMMERGLKGTAASLHPDDLLSLQSHIEKLLSKTVEEKIDHTIEYRFKHKKLGFRWLSDTRRVIFDETGKAIAIIGSTMDVTERKEAEEASRISEKRYKSFIAHAHEGIYRIDFKEEIDINLPREQLLENINRYAVVEEVNEALPRMYGLKADKMVGRPATDFALDYGERIIRMLNNDSCQFFDETEDVDKEGNPLYLHESFHGELRNGKLVHVWGVQVDITNIKQTQKALREREEIFSRMMKNYPGVAYIIDKEGYYLFDEGKGLEKIGLRPNQVVEESWNAFEVYKDNPDLIAAMDNALQGEVTYFTTREHGEYFDLWFGPYADEEGNIIGILGMAENSTEKQLAEIALHKSEKRFRSLFDNMTNGCTIYETSDGQEFIMKDMNHGAEILDDIDKKSMLGKSVSELFPEAVDKGALEPFQQTWRTGEPTSFTASYLVAGREVYRDNFFYKLPTGEIVVLFYDITERKRAEEAMKVFQSVVAASTDAIGISTATGRHSYQNESFDLLFGEIGEDPPASVYVDQAVGREVFAAIMAGEKWIGEVRMKGSDGTIHDIFLRAYAIKDDEGRIQSLIGVHTDITERNRIVEALRENEERFRLLATNLPSVMIYQVIVKPDGGRHFSYVSDNVQYINGVSSEAVLTDSSVLYSQIMPENISDLMAKEEESLQKMRTFKYETRLRLPDGEIRWFQLMSTPRSLADGSVAFDGVEIDITERKKVEEDFRKLREYLANIIDSMPFMLVGVDAECRVTQWNKTTEKRTRISAASAEGKYLDDILSLMPADMDKIRESIVTRQIKQEQKRLRRKGGVTYFEDVTFFPLTGRGLEGAVILIDDVTDLVRMEEMMIQSEKMLSVGGLAAGMAHEINNPLAGMVQTASVIKNRLGGDLNIPANQKAAAAAGTTLEAVRDFMEARGIPNMIRTINESGLRIAAIVSNMLSFARKSENIIASHKLEELVDKTLELAATDYDLKKQYDFKLIEIRKDYGQMVPFVPCEGAKIQQVLLNLFKNGAQAMQQAGVEKPLFIIRSYFLKERKMVCLDIEDNGPGMTEAARKRVFEPFFTTKPPGEGTGLGLSVSYYIITEDHGGEMSVESEPGKGARFIIRLPLGGTDS